jgi:uncharacterized repeat protein (TIGR01451 family)
VEILGNLSEVTYVFKPPRSSGSSPVKNFLHLLRRLDRSLAPHRSLTWSTVGLLSMSTVLVSIDRALALPTPTTPNPLIPARIIANPGFEQPTVADGAGAAVLQGYSTTPPAAWQTTEDTTPYINSLEYWRGVNKAAGGLSTGPHSGQQHVELNASTNSAIYQDLCVLQGETVNWSLWHGARLGIKTNGDQNSDDTNIMRVTISDPTAWVGKTPPSTLLYSSPNLTTAFSQGWQQKTGIYSHSGISQRLRFAFNAIQGSQVSGTQSISYGNFLDDVSLGLAPVIDFLPTDAANGVNISTATEGNVGLPYYLSLRVNGRLQSAATVTINVAGVRAPRSFTVGAPLQGSTAISGLSATTSGNSIILTLPAGDYDPNNTANYIHVPIDFGNITYQPNDNASFALTSATGGGSGNIIINSSTCSVPITTVPTTIVEDDAWQIQGRVFEDVDYGGGNGRSFTASSGSLRPNVRVELYKSDGTFYGSTNTTSSGVYTFSNVPTNTPYYYVRVVNSTVTSSRAVNSDSSASGLLPVQTFRSDASSGVVAEDPNRVGGEVPSGIDAGNGSAGSILSASGAFSGNLSGQAQSIAKVTAGVTNLDFGYNFDTIVNTRNSGQGSLRQFILNSNALSNNTTNLNQVGKTAGVETSIFMIPQTALTGNVAKIAVAANNPLPAITDVFTHLDGRTQTTNIGNTNNIILGSAGPVGVNPLTLNRLNGPEVEIYDANGGTSANQVGLSMQANDTTVTGIAIWGFGADTSTSTTASKGNIIIAPNKTRILIDGNAIGTAANSFSDPGASRSGGYGISSQADASNTSTVQAFTNNLIGYNGWGGLEIGYASGGITVTGNEFRGNAINAFRADGTAITAGGGLRVENNLFSNNWGPGIDTPGSSGGNLYRNNTIEYNGWGAGANNGQNSGLRLQGTNNIVEKNVIRNNHGAGILVRSTAHFNLISQNSIYSNGSGSGQIGIDLVANGGNEDTGMAPFVSANLSTPPAGSNANDLLQYPVLTEATIGSGNLILKGFAPAGARIEVFIADGETNPSPRPHSYGLNFGEGKTYLTTVTEGSAADTDSTSGSYANDGTGAGTALGANRFSFSMPLTSLNGQTLNVGTPITATASLLNGTATVGGSSLPIGKTSEFSGVVQVTATTAKPGLQLVKRITAIRNGSNASTPNINPNDSTALNSITVNANWPSGYLVGAIDGGKVRPGDEMEYTIYFANVSSLSLARARICDLLQPNQTYVPNSMTLAIGTSTPQALTDVGDTDGGQFRLANTPTSATDPIFSGCNLLGSNSNGVVLVDLVSTSGYPSLSSLAGFNGVGTTNSYGFLRFRAKVN